MPPVVSLLGALLLLAGLIPSYYSADTLIFVQPQRVSSKIVEAPDKDELKERLEALVQEILSRQRLKSIIDRFRLYPELRGATAAERAIRKFRKAIDITPAKSPTGAQLLQTFQLTYTHRDPKTALEVTKALANLFIEESLVDRQSVVKGTEEFLDAQLAEARKRLEDMEARVREYVSVNAGKLPEHAEQAVARLTNLQAQLDSNTQLITANMARRSALESELAEVKRLGSALGGESSDTLSYDPQEAIEQLESALVVLRSRYTEQHPEVVQTKKKIQALRQEISRGGGRPARGPVRQSGVSTQAQIRVRRDLGEVDAQILGLRQESVRLKEQIDRLNKDIAEMPIRDQELKKINRDYENVKLNYQKLMAAREEAGIESSLIRSQKGTQFRIVEPAEMPTIPAGPPRLLIGLATIAISLLLLGGIPVAMYFLNSAFRNKGEIIDSLGLNVLGVIPPMVTPEAIVRSRRQYLTSAAVSTMSFLAMATAILLLV